MGESSCIKAHVASDPPCRLPHTFKKDLLILIGKGDLQKEGGTEIKMFHQGAIMAGVELNQSQEPEASFWSPTLVQDP